MKPDELFSRELAAWARRPGGLSPADAARNITARLAGAPRPSPRSAAPARLGRWRLAVVPAGLLLGLLLADRAAVTLPAPSDRPPTVLVVRLSSGANLYVPIAPAAKEDR